MAEASLAICGSSDTDSEKSILEEYENGSLKGMTVEGQLDSGLYGPIWRAVLPTGERCAAKEVHTTKLKLFLKECSVHRRLDHPSIVRFWGVSQLESKSRPAPVLVHVTELLSMDLYRCKELFPGMRPSITLSILCDIAEGMAYLHSLKPPIVHSDLAPRHILLTDHMRAKISGFWAAQVLDGTPLESNPCRGFDISFMPPESFSANPNYDGKLDVYSFGVLVVFIVATDFDGILDENFQISGKEDLYHSIGDHCLYPLTEQCLQKDPIKRIDSDSVVQHLKQLSRKHPRCLKDILELRNIEDVDVVSCTLQNIFAIILCCSYKYYCRITMQVSSISTQYIQGDVLKYIYKSHSLMGIGSLHV